MHEAGEAAPVHIAGFVVSKESVRLILSQSRFCLYEKRPAHFEVIAYCRCIADKLKIGCFYWKGHGRIHDDCRVLVFYVKKVSKFRCGGIIKQGIITVY
ncbi:MAG: hypothetical protein ACREBA_05185 [Nitrosotalea sp.]